MKTKLLKKLRKNILKNFEYQELTLWIAYYRVKYNGTIYESEIVSVLNYFLTGGKWFIRKVILEEVKKMRENSAVKYVEIKEDDLRRNNESNSNIQRRERQSCLSALGKK